jgi:hypothetical protein
LPAGCAVKGKVVDRLLALLAAQANEELIGTLHEHETDDSARFDRMEREWEKQRRDPDDVFLRARDRKQEIKEQIRDLLNALDRQHPRRKPAKKRH